MPVRTMVRPPLSSVRQSIAGAGEGADVAVLVSEAIVEPGLEGVLELIQESLLRVGGPIPFVIDIAEDLAGNLGFGTGGFRADGALHATYQAALASIDAERASSGVGDLPLAEVPALPTHSDSPQPRTLIVDHEG